MKLSIEDIGAISDIIKVSLTYEEEIKLLGDLNRLLKYIDEMHEQDTEGMDPVSNYYVVPRIIRE